MRVVGIKKAYGDRVVFDGLEIEFPDGKITCVMGKSGVGKTTLLKILAGLTPYTGRVEGCEKVAFVFQEPRLIAHMSVEENIAFAVGRDALIKEKIAKLLAEVGLKGMEKRLAKTLSGGEASRVALVRAFAYGAPVILMDEPFADLDGETKAQVKKAFLKLWEEKKQTVVIVTHDQAEALELGEKVVELAAQNLENIH